MNLNIRHTRMLSEEFKPGADIFWTYILTFITGILLTITRNGIECKIQNTNWARNIERLAERET